MKVLNILTDLLSYSDWITPLAAMTPTGRRHTFFIRYREAYKDGHKPVDIALLLAQNGINLGAPFLRGNTLCVDVPPEQAYLAQLVMIEAGVPIRSGQLDGTGESGVRNLFGVL